MYSETNAKDLSPAAVPRKIQTVTNNFFRDTGYSTSNQKMMSGTSTSNFYGTQSNFNPSNSLTSNLENLDAGQLKERLLVAETLMKKLYNRNKELENYHKLQQNAPVAQSSIGKSTEPAASSSDYKIELEKELEEKQKIIERLQNEVIELAKRGNRNDTDKHSTYVEFLENRLAETQAESSRMLQKYSEVRALAFT